MVRTTLFQDNGYQVVRLADEVAFPETVRSVMVLRDGERRVIVPLDSTWDDFFDAPGIALGDRAQPPLEPLETRPAPRARRKPAAG